MAAAIALGALAIGCGRGVQAPEADVRDSLGIRIVTNGRGIQPAAWTVAETPTLHIGAEGDPRYEFQHIVGATRLNSVRIVVADAGGSTLRWYAPDGSWVSTIGGPGEGPGEFLELRWLARSADSLVAFDERQQRLSVFDSAGDLVRLIRLDAPGGSGLGMFADGSVLVTRNAWPTKLEPGIARHPIRIVKYSPAGRLLDTLMTVPGPEVTITLEGGGIAMEPPPDAHNTVFSVHGDRLFVGTQEETEIRVFIESGGLHAIARWTRARVPPGKPAFGHIVADALGNLWVEDRFTDSTGRRRWLILDEKLVLRGTIVLPPQFVPLDIGSEYALGRWTREDGAEEVRLYSMARN